jgi:hypothetical protein
MVPEVKVRTGERSKSAYGYARQNGRSLSSSLSGRHGVSNSMKYVEVEEFQWESQFHPWKQPKRNRGR